MIASNRRLNTCLMSRVRGWSSAWTSLARIQKPQLLQEAFQCLRKCALWKRLKIRKKCSKHLHMCDRWLDCLSMITSCDLSSSAATFCLKTMIADSWSDLKMNLCRPVGLEALWSIHTCVRTGSERVSLSGNARQRTRSQPIACDKRRSLVLACMLRTTLSMVCAPLYVPSILELSADLHLMYPQMRTNFTLMCLDYASRDTVMRIDVTASVSRLVKPFAVLHSMVLMPSSATLCQLTVLNITPRLLSALYPRSPCLLLLWPNLVSMDFRVRFQPTLFSKDFLQDVLVCPWTTALLVLRSALLQNFPSSSFVVLYSMVLMSSSATLCSLAVLNIMRCWLLTHCWMTPSLHRFRWNTQYVSPGSLTVSSSSKFSTECNWWWCFSMLSRVCKLFFVVLVNPSLLHTSRYPNFPTFQLYPTCHDVRDDLRNLVRTGDLSVCF